MWNGYRETRPMAERERRNRNSDAGCRNSILELEGVFLETGKMHKKYFNFKGLPKNVDFETQEGKNEPKKIEKINKFHVFSVGCSLLRAEGF
jgi:hypothetical protein